VIFVFVTVLIDVLAFGIVIPVLPQLIRGFVGGDYAAAAIWVGTFAAIYAIAQFFCSPILGALSDRFGRRPVILLSNLGLGLNFTLMALATSLPVLFAARLVSGLAGSSSGTANAYIADVTTPDKRASAFGLLGAAFGIGFVIGPALGGVLGAIHLRLPFWFAAGLALTNFLYGYFVLPESLPREKRSTTFEWKRANPFGSLLLLRSYRHVFGLAGLVFVSNLAHYALPSTFVLYADYRYGWSEQKVGYVLAFVGLCNAIVQAALVRRVVPRFGERRALLTGLAFGAAGFATMGLAPEGMLFLIGVPLLGLWGLSGPSIQALLTRRVPEDQQGRLQGAVTSLAAVAGIFAPWLFTHVFAWFIDNPNGLHVPGAAFLLSASLLLGGFVLAWRVAR
jgi:DHA1 family tetracycline resistance protein-like MFS transporter